MPSVSDNRPAVSPLLTAALLLAALSVLRALRLPHPTVEQVLDATGATRSRAYKLKQALLGLLPTVERPVGRPRTEPAQPPPDTSPLAGQVLDFLMQHPGCAQHCGRRRRYSVAFRCFILELAERNKQVPLNALSEAVHVPLGTLKDWLCGGRRDTEILPTKSTAASTDPVTAGRVETLIVEWRRWQGTFSAFCDHISLNLRIPFGRTLIASILEQSGERTPRRRTGRSPDERALRGAFETFFPGAQWVGDGKAIDVQIGQEHFTFNLELMIDADSAAAVGVSIRDEEDSAAVREAFDNGVQTTGQPPLCVLLDNRPSNHTAEVEQALGATMPMAATKARPQNKAHVEGAFGLFSQVVPLLAITATSPHEVGRQLLQLVVQTWACTLNHKPVKSSGGRSRAETYTVQTPSPEQVEQARAALEARIRQQELARQTLMARHDPVVRAILDDALARLQLLDPQGNIRAAIARYPLDAVVAGIATFEGKRRAGTLPPDVDARYLLGIVRNISQQDEGQQITEALLRARLDARDRLLAPLQSSLDAILRHSTSTTDVIKDITDCALKADRHIDRLFWLDAIVKNIRDQHTSRHAALLRFAALRIQATFAVPYRDRLTAVRFICARVITLR